MPINAQQAEKILSDLIALPTVNPMGRPCEGSVPIERPVTEYLESLFAPFGVGVVRDTFSTPHENLIVSIPGRVSGLGTLLESHMDTVPADDWLDRAFVPRVENGRIFGRGACDDKGPLTSMVLAVLDLLESGELPPAPVCLLAAGDEEYAQTGIKHFARTCTQAFGRGVFGEATRSIPVVQHKGTIRWDITVHGQSAHTSRPELGRSAIRGAIRVIEALDAHQAELHRRYPNPLMTGPNLTVTMIQGGRTRNAVPDECRMAVDFRVVPGMDPALARGEVITMLERLDIAMSHSEVQLLTPPLDTRADDAFPQTVLGFCSRRLGTEVALRGEPYGTDAAWMPGNGPAIVLGPGGIETAHAVDECIDISDVVTCAEIFSDIIRCDWNQ